MFKQQAHNTIASNRHALPVLDGGFVVGVDIGGTNLRLALADTSGKILARWSALTSGVKDAHIVVESIATGVNHLLEQCSLDHNSLRAIAAGAPGVVNVDTGIVVATSYLMGWRDVPLRELLETAIGVPAAVDNDVNLAALGESWIGAASHAADFVFLAVGTGVGAGIVLDHKLFRGRGWTAGEIGYMLVPGASESPAEFRVPGAFECLVGGEAIKAHWRSVWNPAKTALPPDLLATQVFDHALQGEPLAQSVLEQSARTLAYGIFNIALVLNCPLFVLGGSVGVHPALVNKTRAMLAQRSAEISPEVTGSALGGDAQLLGAVRFALDTANLRTTNF